MCPPFCPHRSVYTLERAGLLEDSAQYTDLYNPKLACTDCMHELLRRSLQCFRLRSPRAPPPFQRSSQQTARISCTCASTGAAPTPLRSLLTANREQCSWIARSPCSTGARQANWLDSYVFAGYQFESRRGDCCCAGNMVLMVAVIGCRNWKERPSASTLLQHPFLADVVCRTVAAPLNNIANMVTSQEPAIKVGQTFYQTRGAARAQLAFSCLLCFVLSMSYYKKKK